ncbi:glycosyltransferase family 4 protein [Desulfosporosinus sp.]|uniref:glycosyltransferase family 4 protein n=1 Tax=Desulfosporosinus sp. TaxID=157907 RepID=UPI00260FEAF6|nr:glycosyltransferase family 4 protein [Desulfosporosinus sp.]
MKYKVVLITGSYPPDTCGVGDYTASLVAALQKCGINVEVLHTHKWHLSCLNQIIKHLNSLKPDIVHIQYPTVGYGSSLMPHMLSLFKNRVITIHENSQSHILRRLSLYFFFMRSKHLIFIKQFELDYTKRWAPWISRRASVIHIGSNIPVGHTSNRDIKDIIYFGLIVPKKGLDDFLKLATLIKMENLNLRLRIVGLPNPKRPDYLDYIYKKASNLPISFEIGLPKRDVAQLLSRAQIAYMPFPDGASEWRSSLMALLINGVATITTYGKHTPENFKKAVAFAQSPEDALTIVKKLTTDAQERETLSINGKQCAESYSWDNIAQRHIQIYENIFLKKFSCLFF